MLILVHHYKDIIVIYFENYYFGEAGIIELLQWTDYIASNKLSLTYDITKMETIWHVYDIKE